MANMPLLQECFPAWVKHIRFWKVDDAPEALTRIEHEVRDQAARLMGGRQVRGVTS
jgi:hypothetical protein